MGFKIDCLFDQGSDNLGIAGYLGEFDKRRRLTREVVPADHCTYPNIARLEYTTREPGFSSEEKYKSVLKENLMARFPPTTG
jgi:hypothetical protein